MSFTSMNSPFQSPSSSPGLLRGGSMVAGVEVSVLSSESHTLNNTVTKVALESGAKVTDHVIVEPDEVSVSFAMTNAGGGAEAARDAFESFKRMRDERTLLELITEHHVYDNMVVASVCAGWPDETISSRAWRWHASGVRSWPCKLIDAIFWFDPEHCRESYLSERLGRQMPPEVRRSGPRLKKGC